jgi:UDP-N-acetyl-D-galactosamine dehydrogenase
LKKGDIVVYESTVYPGATEEDCVPILEQASGLLAGRDFTVGYSPERINPGDKAHRFETIKKVVAGQDARTLDIVAAVYGSVVRAGLHKAPSIKVAEAAKVIENAQRDLNIAFMNELSAIFHALDIDTQDVLSAAATKWNFLNFTPGLVGGHCIGVDPYYLTYRAQKAGYHPDVILAGRRINDSIGVRVARECLRRLLKAGASAPRVTVLGLTFKENVVDVRNSQVFDIIREFQSFGVTVQVHDPLADDAAALKAYGLTLQKEPAPADAVVLAVAHDFYRASGWPLITRLLTNGRGLVMDVKGVLDPHAKPAAIEIWRL